MFRRYSVNFALFSMVMDGSVVCASLLAATHLRPWLGFLPFAAEYPAFVPAPWIIYLVFALEWILIAQLLSVYDGRRNVRPVNEFTHLSLAALLATVALAGTLYLSYRMVSRLLFLVFVGLAYIIALPFTFAYALASMIANSVLNLLSKEAAFGWRPLEAYLSGRKKRKKKESEMKQG